MKWIGLLLVLCGCASDVVLPPPQVSTADFAVTTFPNGVYSITYKGSTTLPNERLLDLTLLKASRVAQDLKSDYFVIIDQTASTPGEIKYRRALPSADEWDNELLFQAFKGRPERTFCFSAEGTERSINEKLRTAPEPEPL